MNTKCLFCGRQLNADGACPKSTCGGSSFYVLECIDQIQRGNGVTAPALFRDLNEKEKGAVRSYVSSQVVFWATVERKLA